MNQPPISKPLGVPMSRRAVVDAYFMEHRGKLIDIAAFLDRVDRAAPGSADASDDFRLAALRAALMILSDGRPERARRVLELLSDRSVEPVAAAGTKGAAGAPGGAA
jgi:hypothetical protein